MKIGETFNGHLRPMLVKALATSAVGVLMGVFEADSSSTSAASSAWKEIESKLHGIFGSEEEKKKESNQGKHIMRLLAVIVALLLISYLLGRRQGRGRATVLEVHKA